MEKLNALDPQVVAEIERHRPSVSFLESGHMMFETAHAGAPVAPHDPLERFLSAIIAAGPDPQRRGDRACEAHPPGAKQ